MHPDAEQIERLRHGELAPHQEAELRAHLAGCAACAEHAAAAAREEAQVLALLRRLDHPPPRLRPRDLTRRGALWPPHGARAAAGIVLALAAAGLLYAAPGSPLPRLLQRALGGASPRAAPPARAREPSLPAAAGVAVLPGASFTITFQSPRRGAVARVRLVDSDELSVRAAGAAVPFSVDAGGVSIASGGADAEYEVLLPRAAPLVRILLAGRTLLLKQAGAVTSVVPPDAAGVYRLPLGPATPRPP